MVKQADEQNASGTGQSQTTQTEERSQETQELKSKVMTEFKVFCLVISLHCEK